MTETAGARSHSPRQRTGSTVKRIGGRFARLNTQALAQPGQHRIGAGHGARAVLAHPDHLLADGMGVKHLVERSDAVHLGGRQVNGDRDPLYGRPGQPAVVDLLRFVEDFEEGAVRRNPLSNPFPRTPSPALSPGPPSPTLPPRNPLPNPPPQEEEGVLTSALLLLLGGGFLGRGFRGRVPNTSRPTRSTRQPLDPRRLARPTASPSRPVTRGRSR